MSDTLHESLISGDTSASNIYGTNWAAQSFTADANYTITSVKLYLARWYLATPGNLYVSIRLADANNKPTGSDLDISAAVSGNTLPTWNGSGFMTGEWKEFVLTTGVALTSGTKYTIVLKNTTNASNHRAFIKFNPSEGYASGKASSSTDSGSTWSQVTGRDYLFENYGIIPAFNIIGSCSAEGSMTGLVTVNLALIVGSCSAEASLTGLAYIAIWPISGGCSAEGGMSGSAYLGTLPISGSCSAEASLTGLASTALLLVGNCSAEASLTGLATAFIYIVGSMSATGHMSIRIVSYYWPSGRWSDYDEDLTWDEETGTWVATVVGPARYKNQLVVVGQGDANQGEIYFG